jgi:hypothetical protein
MKKYEFTVLGPTDDAAMQLIDRITIEADNVAQAAKRYSDMFARVAVMPSATVAEVGLIGKLHEPRPERPVAVLPTGKFLNPKHPDTAEYYDPGQTAYIMVTDGSRRIPRVVTSFGSPDSNWAIGSRHVLKHDQSGMDMGRFEIVGIAVFKRNTTIGNVPNRLLRHYVMK